MPAISDSSCTNTINFCLCGLACHYGRCTSTHVTVFPTPFLNARKTHTTSNPLQYAREQPPSGAFTVVKGRLRGLKLTRLQSYKLKGLKRTLQFSVMKRFRTSPCFFFFSLEVSCFHDVSFRSFVEGSETR